jgi:hypothetical protein
MPFSQPDVLLRYAFAFLRSSFADARQDWDAVSEVVAILSTVESLEVGSLQATDTTGPNLYAETRKSETNNERFFRIGLTKMVIVPLYCFAENFKTWMTRVVP